MANPRVQGSSQLAFPDRFPRVRSPLAIKPAVFAAAVWTGLLFASGGALCADNGGDTGSSLLGETSARHHREGVSEKQNQGEAGLRIEVGAPDGEFIVYDATRPPGRPRTAPGYLAYWHDFETEQVYVYGRLMFAWADVGHALLNLDPDLWIDPAPLIGASSTLESAVVEAELEDEDPTQWHPATDPLVLEIMGIEPPPDMPANPWTAKGKTGAANKEYSCPASKAGIWSYWAQTRCPAACYDGNPCTHDICTRDCTCYYPFNYSCGSGPGNPCPGDIDCDGIPDELDDDIDGDGIPNGDDPDVDGDGILNGDDPDVDGDGIPNGEDSDVDGDGLDNCDDPDIDGDGLCNEDDPDMDGDGIDNGDDPDADGDGVPDDATLSLDPSSIPAKTDWPDMPPNISESDITVAWDPPECEGTLEIVELALEGYTPPSEGTLTRDSETLWRYEAYEEPQTTLCSAPVNVKIAALKGEQELERVSVRVLPVHTFFTTGANADFQKDYYYITWKYAAVLATTQGGFSDPPTFSTDVEVYCGTWPLGKYGYACTTCNPLTGNCSVVFGTSTFTGSENQAASIIGHELVHTTGVTDECVTYTWEFNHDTGTGIFQCDASYLADVVQMMNCECSGINCPP